MGPTRARSISGPTSSPTCGSRRPCRLQPPPGDCLPFERANISILPQKEAGGETLWAKLGLLASIPGMVLAISRAPCASADAIHVRCPGNLGLIGAVLAPLFSRRIIAKYAAQWNGGDGEPFSARLQRAILRSRWWKGPVTVYGAWPGSPRHVIPFFTSLLTADQLDRAKASAARERRGPGLRVLYTGRLSKAKNVDVLLRAVARVRAAGDDVATTIIGQGPERANLEEARRRSRHRRADEFHRRPAVRSGDRSPLRRRRPGRSRRKPRAGPNRSPRAWRSAWPASGRTSASSRRCSKAAASRCRRATRTRLPPRSAGSPHRPTVWRRCAEPAALWAQRYSLEGLRDALRDLMSEWWGDRPIPPVGAHAVLDRL